MFMFGKLLNGLIIALVLASSSWIYAVELGQKLKSLNVHSDQGKLDLLHVAPAKFYVFNFWATWCEACKIELKEMDELFLPFASDKNLKLAFISLDKEMSAAKSWIQSELKGSLVRNRVFYDPEFLIADELEIDAFPMTLILNAKFEVVHIQRGFKQGERATELMVELIKNKLSDAASK